MGHLKILAALLLIGCTPAGEAAEAALENRVDEFIDYTVERLCDGPIDIAVRTAERYPALMTAAFEVCPNTYGKIRDAVLAGVARDDAVVRAIQKIMANQQ